MSEECPRPILKGTPTPMPHYHNGLIRGSPQCTAPAGRSRWDVNHRLESRRLSFEVALGLRFRV